jgi:biopolymer transport protein ExbD
MRRLSKRPVVRTGDPLIPLLSLVSMLIPMLIFGAVFVKFKTLEVKPPKVVPPPRAQLPDEKALDLTVMITDQGFHFKVNQEFREPWMAQAFDGAGPDIPRAADDWDFETLTDRLRQIKGSHARETRIILGAEDHIAFDVLIQAMDHARGTDDDQLFPNVTLTRGVV